MSRPPLYQTCAVVAWTLRAPGRRVTAHASPEGWQLRAYHRGVCAYVATAPTHPAAYDLLASMVRQ